MRNPFGFGYSHTKRNNGFVRLKTREETMRLRRNGRASHHVVVVKPLRSKFDLTPALQRAGYAVPPAILLREGYAKRLDPDHV